MQDPYRCMMPYPFVAQPHAPEGPLRGLRLVVKDLFDVKGYPTSCGSPHMLALSGIKRKTAPIVTKLLRAGAAFVGKTHTDELAYSLNGKNIHFGCPVNPAAPDRVPGGSSSGSMVAVAGNLADIGLGTDTGGSVRGPASYGGLFGIRPTHGRLSLEGCWPLAPSCDTAGFFTRDAATLARVADVVFGAAREDSTANVRWLLAQDAFALADEGAQRALRAATDRALLRLNEAEPVDIIGKSDPLYWAFRNVQGYEAWRTDREFLETHRPMLGKDVRERLEYASKLSDEQYAEGLKVRKRFRAKLARILGKDGVILMPTMPDVAPLLTAGEEELEDFRARALRLLCVAVLTGFPQVTIPAAMKNGAPLGLSLLGPKGSDRRLVALAERFADAAAIRIA